MYSIIIRKVIMFASFGAALIFFANQMWMQGATGLGVSAILLVLQVRFGTVQQAMKQLNKGDFNKAAKLLGQIKKPNQLSKLARAYYFFCNGYIHMSRNQFELAKAAFQAALETGLKLETDQAIAQISLANIFAMEGKKAKAKEHLKIAKSLESNDSVADAVAKVESQIKAM
jgi:tetratricopeptide (TPR) repeat protein